MHACMCVRACICACLGSPDTDLLLHDVCLPPLIQANFKADSMWQACNTSHPLLCAHLQPSVSSHRSPLSMGSFPLNPALTVLALLGMSVHTAHIQPAMRAAAFVPAHLLQLSLCLCVGTCSGISQRTIHNRELTLIDWGEHSGWTLLLTDFL